MRMQPEEFSRPRQYGMDYDLGLQRVVSGETIATIFSRLSRLALQTSGIELPVNPTGEVSPRVQLIKSKEIKENRYALDPARVKRSVLTPICLEKVPSLSDPLPVTIRKVGYDISRSGAHFMNLAFNMEDGDRLKEEREALWEVIQEEGSTDPEAVLWEPYAPDMRVAYFSPDVPRGIVKSIAGYIQKQINFDATLEAVRLPEQKNLTIAA